MNETELTNELLKLRAQVQIEFDNSREDLWAREKSVTGLIDGLVDKINASIGKMMEDMSHDPGNRRLL